MLINRSLFVHVGLVSCDFGTHICKLVISLGKHKKQTYKIIMIEERELIILKKSIAMLNGFSEKIESVNSGREFISIHNRNLETIQKIAIERNSEYLKNKLIEYPKLKVEEINDYIRTKKNERSILFFLFSYMGYFLIDRIIRMIKTKGSSPALIKSKIIKVESVNKEVLKVIENPYLEELYKNNSI